MAVQPTKGKGIVTVVTDTAGIVKDAVEIATDIVAKVPGAEVVIKQLQKAWEILKVIKDRIEKIGACHEAAKGILEKVDFIESRLNRIQPYVGNDEDALQMREFYLHLENAKEKCDTINQESTVRKFFKGRRMLTELNKVEDDLKKASQQLTLFVETVNLTANQDKLVRLHKSMENVAILSENCDTGICVVLDKNMKCPTAPVLSYVATADEFILSWKPNDPTVSKYELCYNEDTLAITSIEGCATEVKIGAPRVEPGRIYTMKIRGINSGGKGQWSNSIVAQFTKPVPRQPPEPEITLVSPTTAEITLRSPEKVCRNESPVTEWLLEYIEDGADREWCKMYHTSEPHKKYSLLSLKILKPDRLYHFKISAKNAEGWSIPSRVIKKSTKIHVVPSQPTKLRISSKRSHSLIKIRWNAPDSYVTHYEVRMRRRKDRKYDGKPLNVKNKLSSTFLNLQHNTHYVFQVQACNGALSSGWCNEIEGNTRIHKAIKAVFSPAVFLGATISSPVIGAVGLGHDAKKANKSTATVAALGTGGAVAGTLGAPLMGGMLTHLFVHGLDKLSDQSDDES